MLKTSAPIGAWKCSLPFLENYDRPTNQQTDVTLPLKNDVWCLDPFFVRKKKSNYYHHNSTYKMGMIKHDDREF